MDKVGGMGGWGGWDGWMNGRVDAGVDKLTNLILLDCICFHSFTTNYPKCTDFK